MIKFKIGDWIIGPPQNYPIKITDIVSVTGSDKNKTVEEMTVKGFRTNGSQGLFDLNSDDRLATEVEIGGALTTSFVEQFDDAEVDKLLEYNNDELNATYNADNDALFINGILVYEDTKFIELI